MRMYDLIEKKKLGMELTTDEIRFMIDGFTDGSIPDYQMSAMTMAICFQGMSKRETVDLTLAMRDSGDVLDLSSTVIKSSRPISCRYLSREALSLFVIDFVIFNCLILQY